MSYTYLQDQGEESSAGCFSDISQYAQLNLKKMLETSSFKDNEKEHCLGSLSGTMFAHLTGSHGKELPTLCAEDSHAKTSAQQDSEKGFSKALEADCGQKWQGSFTKWSQDLFLWKTRQLSLLMDSESFSGTWPQWGMMHDGECWELTIEDFHTIAEGHGLLPTVVKNEGIAFLGGPIRSNETWRDTGRLSHRLIGLWKNFAEREMNGRIKQKIACHPIFAEWMMNWPEMWSGSQELEMGKFQAWLRLHSKPYLENKTAV